MLYTEEVHAGEKTQGGMCLENIRQEIKREQGNEGKKAFCPGSLDTEVVVKKTPISPCPIVQKEDIGGLKGRWGFGWKPKPERVNDYRLRA